MYYVKLHDIDNDKAVKMIDDALSLQGMSRLDLVRKLGLVFERKGLGRLDRLFDGQIDINLLRRIGRFLNLCEEELCGEKSFDNLTEYEKYIFVPYLRRVPNKIPVATEFFSAASRSVFLKKLTVASFPDLVNATREEQLAVVKKHILSDQNTTPQRWVPIGYVFFYEYQKSLALSIEGDLLPDVYVVEGADRIPGFVSSSGTCGEQ